MSSVDQSIRDMLANSIRALPDYPKPGIMFRDITTLMLNPKAFQASLTALQDAVDGQDIDYVAGIDARGLVFGGALADRFSCGFVPLRKKGKLPFETLSVSYDLEYGSAEMELHKDAINAGDKVYLIDDLIATGGTAEAAIKLIRQLGGEVVAAGFVVDLPDIGGRKKLEEMGVPVHTLVEFEGD